MTLNPQTVPLDFLLILVGNPDCSLEGSCLYDIEPSDCSFGFSLRNLAFMKRKSRLFFGGIMLYTHVLTLNPQTVPLDFLFMIARLRRENPDCSLEGLCLYDIVPSDCSFGFSTYFGGKSRLFFGGIMSYTHVLTLDPQTVPLDFLFMNASL